MSTNDKVYSREEFDALSPGEVYTIAKGLRISGVAAMTDENVRTRLEEELVNLGRLGKAQEGATTTATQTPQPVRQATAATATVRYGAHSAALPVVGKTIDAVRRELSPTWNIDANASVYVDSQTASGNHVVQAGQVLEFIRPAGQKG